MKKGKKLSFALHYGKQQESIKIKKADKAAGSRTQPKNGTKSRTTRRYKLKLQTYEATHS